MAKQVKSPIPDNLFDKAIAGANAFLDKIQEIIGAFKKIGTEGKKALKEIDLKKAEGVADLSKQIKKLEEQTVALTAVKKEQAKIEKELEKAEKAQAKEKVRLAREVEKERVKSVKAVEKAEAASAKESEKRTKQIAKGKAQAAKALEKLQKNEERTSKELLKQEKKVFDQSEEGIKLKLEQQKASKKQRDELKALIALEDKQVGTLEKLNAANTLLRIERSKLNAEIPEQRQRFESLNAEIDENNAKIVELSDKQKQAKINVGNYTESINEALMSSAGFTSASSELSEAQGVLSSIMKVSTLILGKNEKQTDDNAKATTKLGRTTQRTGKIIKGSLIGLVAIAAGAVGKFITGTQEGQIQFQSFIGQVTGGLNVIIGRFIDLGKGLSKLANFDLKGASKSFNDAFRSGLVDDIRDVNAAVSELVQTQFQAANAARAVQADIERRIQLEEELREIFDDDTRGFRERQAAAAELTKIFLTGNSSLTKQSELLKDQLEIARERALIAIKERAGATVDTEALRSQISSSRELSEAILSNKKLLGESGALIIDTAVLDELIEAEKAFIQKETELNSKRLQDRQLIAKLLFDEVEQEVDFLIDANAQVQTSNFALVASEKETFAERRKVLNDTIKLIQDANKAVQVEIAKTAEGVEGADIAQAFSAALNVSDLNRRLKDLGLAEIPINRLLELFKEIKTQERDFKDVGEILDQALTGGREAGDRIKILKESNVEIKALADKLLELGRVDVSSLSGEKLKDFNKELEALNEQIDEAKDARARQLLELEIQQLEARLNLARKGSQEFLEIEEELLGKKLDLISAEEAAVLDAIDKEDKAREDAAKKDNERQKKLADDRAKALKFLDNALSANSESRQKDLDKQIESAKTRQDEIQKAIIAGSEGAQESLAKARREEEEAALAKSKLLDRQKQQEAVLTMLKLLSAYAGAGDPNPLGRASKDLVGASAFADAFFYKGTEKVSEDSQLKKVHGGRDGYRVAVDGSERIMAGKHNNKIGNLSNDILAEVGFLYRTGSLVTKGESGGSAMSVEELRQVNKNLRELPKRMPVATVEKDLITGIVSDVLKRDRYTRKSRVSWSTQK